MKKLIKNGTIVTEENIFKGDILVKNERIEAIGTNLDDSVDQIIKADGLYVMPGGVDPHCHIQMKLGEDPTVDDYETSTIAAAFGGTTSIIDIAFQDQGGSLKDAVKKWHKKASNKAVIDYTFHAGIVDPSEKALAEMEDIVNEGIPSFKVFTANPGLTLIEDHDLLRIFQRAKRLGGMMVVHAENGGFTEELGRQAVENGNGAPKFWPDTRPPETEAEAVQRVTLLSEMFDVPTHFYHITSKLAVDEIAKARSRGVNIYAETCPHYLYLTVDRLADADGAKYMCSPPLRPESDIEALWDSLNQDELQVVSSDHCAYLYKEQKEKHAHDFRKIPGGLPGVETRMPVMFNSVKNNKLSLNRLVQTTATNPAKIFGLYPKKGTISIGSDADIVLWNPDSQWVIKSDELHMGVDYTPFEDFFIQGSPQVVMSRGQVIINDGKFVGKVGTGQFIKRKTMNHKLN